MLAFLFSALIYKVYAYLVDTAAVPSLEVSLVVTYLTRYELNK
jgi:hypothetical protein